MRYLIALAALGLCLVAADVHARLFRQTYGAVTPTPEGDCQWNAGQDYFVPRHCDSCRYDLFSACKTSHTTSAACIFKHPLYAGYCTPYSACRYRWRDHVYKTFCGCTPLRCTYGPWRNEECREGCCLFGHKHKHKNCGAGGCGSQPCGARGAVAFGDGSPYYGNSRYDGELPHVEPFGGEVLGSIAAIPGGMLGGGASPSLGAIPADAGGVDPSQILPSLGIPTAPAGNLTYP